MVDFKGFHLFFIIFHTTCFISLGGCSVVKSKSAENFTLNDYNSYQSITEWLTEVQQANSDLVSMVKLANTFEGRPMYLMKIVKNDAKKKPTILIDANIHAREWVSSATALNLINELVKTPSMTDLVNWYIIPMVNPDGYEYSRTPGNRMWRKNRSKRSGSDCYGVDLNRNYGDHWGLVGSDTDPCSFELYAGPKAFSEIESSAVRDVMLNNRGIKLYISLHSYGQLLLYPYGYTTAIEAPNSKSLRNLGLKMAAAIAKTTGSNYQVESGADLYPASGASDDYAYSHGKIPYVYTMEMTNDSFEYPSYQLSSLYDETMAAFKVAANKIGKDSKHKLNVFKYLLSEIL